MLPPAGDGDAVAVGAGPRSSSPSTVDPDAITRTRPGRNLTPGLGLSASARAALAVAVLGLVARASAEQKLPYIPTTVLVPPDGDSKGSSVAYIFSPNADDPNAVDFLSLDLSSTLRASSLAPTKLTSPLPFLNPDSDNGSNPAFAPSMLQNGTIAVVVGDCSSELSPSLWTYTPGSTSPQWVPHTITTGNTPNTSQTVPYHLSTAVSFSAQLSPTISPSTVYLYGGMCLNTTTSDWKEPLYLYSNTMLRLSPPSSSSSSPFPYTLSLATTPSTPHPISAAGFTLTHLPPSLSNTSSPQGKIITQQQTTHVLLGGHTAQQAFVNMSTAAVWSLPEETWTFLSIASDGPEGKGGSVSVDSRSGHTTVLSEDGGSLVVYGGWVGDMGTRAEPQLAVVRMGVGLEGWRWEVPESASKQEEEGGGVYGHGAVLLPGNVMMVVGGWEIGGSDGGKRRREVRGRKRTFFNITSLEWVDEYRPPAGGMVDGGGGAGGKSPSGEDSGSDNSSRNRKIGLGVGLGVGLLILLALAAFAIRFFRRRQRRRAARDETLRGLAQGVNGSLPRGLGETDEMLERDHGIFPWTAAAAREWYTGGDDPYANGRRSLGYETLRGGSRSAPSLYIPPASGSSSRPRAARGLYQPSSGIRSGNSYDFAPLTRGSNRIEPIYEADEGEDGDAAKDCTLSPDREDREDDDPFLTPSAVSTPVGGLFPPPSVSTLTTSSPSPEPIQQPQGPQGPQGGQEQDADVQGWVSDIDAATDAVIAARTMSQRRRSNSASATTPPRRHKSIASASGSGRVSPSRRASTKSGKHLSTGDSNSDRTGSNLSERSAFSFAHSSSGGSDDNSNNGTNKKGGPLTRLRAALPAISTTHDNGSQSPSNSSAHTFSTARSNLNFAALQAEGPGLLLGSTTTAGTGNGGSGTRVEETGVPINNPDDDYEMEEDYIPTAPGSPSKSKAPRRSWLGSLRRVFSGGVSESSSNNSANSLAREDSPTREGLLLFASGGEGSDYEVVPRLVGGGGLQMRRRQGGREAWLGGVGGIREGGTTGEGEEDWDVERAVEGRQVQVMFTVPRERLRVVNAEVERDEEQSVVLVNPDEEEEEERERERERETRDEKGAAGVQGDSRPEGGETDESRGKSKDRPSALTLEPPGGISPSASLRAASVTTPTLHTAEAVRLERPRTRVLDMVESIESRSREGSPGGSPTRGS